MSWNRESCGVRVGSEVTVCLVAHASISTTNKKRLGEGKDPLPHICVEHGKPLPIPCFISVDSDVIGFDHGFPEPTWIKDYFVSAKGDGSEVPPVFYAFLETALRRKSADLDLPYLH